MAGDTILYVSDHAGSTSVLAAIEALGHDIVSTNGSNQAMALLFVMHSAAAVVLDLQGREGISLEFARELRAIHPGVPILLRCCEHIDHLPAWVDAYVSVEEPLENLRFLLQRMLSNEPPVHDHRLVDSVRGAA